MRKRHRLCWCVPTGHPALTPSPYPKLEMISWTTGGSFMLSVWILFASRHGHLRLSLIYFDLRIMSPGGGKSKVSIFFVEVSCVYGRGSQLWRRAGCQRSPSGTREELSTVSVRNTLLVFQHGDVPAANHFTCKSSVDICCIPTKNFHSFLLAAR